MTFKNMAMGAALATCVCAGIAYFQFYYSPQSIVKDAPKSEKAVTLLEPVTSEDRAAAAKLVKNISEDKAIVTEVFRGPAGYVGVVVNPGARNEPGEHKFIGWMPATRDTLLVGAMFDLNGKNVTQAEMVTRGYARPELIPQQSAQPGQSVIKQAVDRSEGFLEGTSGPIVTAFVDYNCGFCRELYQRSRQHVAQGMLRIKWVPVAILGDTSLPKAAAVLGYRDASSNMVNPVKGMNLAESGQLPPLMSVSGAMKTTIDANGAVLNLLSGGEARTPMLVLNQPDGTFKVAPGLPQDLMAFVRGTDQ